MDCVIYLLFFVFAGVKQSNATMFHPPLMQSPAPVELELKFSDCLLLEQQHHNKHNLDDFDYLPVWSIYVMATCSILFILCLFTVRARS